MMRRFSLLFIAAYTACVAIAGGVGVPASRADASLPQVRDITFPVTEHVDYSDTYGACRDGCTRFHEGQDLIGSRLSHMVATRDATVTYLRTDAAGTAGNWIKIKDSDGWTYSYMHVNNDTPGTDDGLNPPKYRFPAGIEVGATVKRGDFIAYLGDSGNAESSVPHLHFEIRDPNGEPINAFASLQLAQGIPVAGLCAANSAPTPDPQAGTIAGYLTVSDDGTVTAHGTARHFGDRNASGVSSPVVGIAATPTGAGYWIATSDGTVYRFGDATTEGAIKSTQFQANVVAIAATKVGKGFWLATDDGAVYAFGAAQSYGSATNHQLTSPIVDMVATGNGYALVSERGDVYKFGSAQNFGDTSRLNLNSPIIAIAMTSTGDGYWLLNERGVPRAFGDAAEVGTIPMLGLCEPKVAADMVVSNSGDGYAIMQRNGAIVEFGNAKSLGAATGQHVVDVAQTS